MEYADPTLLRAYFFGNMYISPIQHGIQAAHVVTKLFQKYGRDHDSKAADVLYDWADVGVTKILLNGGYQSNLENIHSILEILCPVLELPYAKFHEEEAALNGALTSVGVVVPEAVYSYVDTSLWLDKDSGIFAHTVPPAKNPAAPTPEEILGYIKKLRVLDPKMAVPHYIVLLHAMLKTARTA